MNARERSNAMKHRIVLAVLLTITTVAMDACGVGPGGCCCERELGLGRSETIRGSGSVIRVTRSVAGIDAVALATVGALRVEFGDREELVIEGEDNIIEHIDTEVDDGTLKIENMWRYSLHPTEPLTYFLTVRKLDAVILSSSGDAILPDIEARSFSIRVSSSGDLTTGKVEAGHLDVAVSSSGDVSVRDLNSESLEVSLSSSGAFTIGGGTVIEQDVRLSSSGTYRAEDLESERADIRLSSSGSAYVLVTEDLRAVLSSSGSVYYSGNPRVRQQTGSSGRVKRLDV
jgi:hypothetical protein